MHTCTPCCSNITFSSNTVLLVNIFQFFNLSYLFGFSPHFLVHEWGGGGGAAGEGGCVCTCVSAYIHVCVQCLSYNYVQWASGSEGQTNIVRWGQTNKCRKDQMRGQQWATGWERWVWEKYLPSLTSSASFSSVKAPIPLLDNKSFCNNTSHKPLWSQILLLISKVLAISKMLDPQILQFKFSIRPSPSAFKKKIKKEAQGGIIRMNMNSWYKWSWDDPVWLTGHKNPRTY